MIGTISTRGHKPVLRQTSSAAPGIPQKGSSTVLQGIYACAQLVLFTAGLQWQLRMKYVGFPWFFQTGGIWCGGLQNSSQGAPSCLFSTCFPSRRSKIGRVRYALLNTRGNYPGIYSTQNLGKLGVASNTLCMFRVDWVQPQILCQNIWEEPSAIAGHRVSLEYDVNTQPIFRGDESVHEYSPPKLGSSGTIPNTPPKFGRLGTI